MKEVNGFVQVVRRCAQQSTARCWWEKLTGGSVQLALKKEVSHYTLRKKEKVMRKILMGALGVFAFGVCTAQMVTYLDSQGKPFMYSSKVGSQVTYFDNSGKPVAYSFNPVASGPRVDPINTPSLVFPMISPSFPGSGTIAPIAPLPELAPLKGF